jgi:thiamine-phosphate pyrophosphorylase
MTSSSSSLESYTPKIERMIDANLNRLKEGLRVIEDICRYVHEDKSRPPQIKLLRHKLQLAYSVDRLQQRDIEGDIQKSSTKSELKRTDLTDLVIANFSRAQESSRVLEESFKLSEHKLSELFKEIRYKLYGLEKYYFSQY